MVIKTTAILLFLFIFGIITPVYGDSVKSTKNTVNQENINKIDGNNAALQKKTGDSKGSLKLLKIKRVETPSHLPYSEAEENLMRSHLDVNFLKTLKENKRSPFIHSVDKVIFSCGFSQVAWNEKFLTLREFPKVKSPNSERDQSHWESYSFANKYSEERRIMEIFKLLEFKKEEITKGIVMGFRLSLNPVSGHLFLEMDTTPSFEKKSGFTIPF